MKTFLFLILVSLPLLSFGQTLYLRLDNALPREFSGTWNVTSPSTKLWKVYGYHSYICGQMLSFVCEDKVNLSNNFPIVNIGNYPVKTIEQVESIVAGMTKNQTYDYFHNMQNIYIVEILPNNMIEVSKVVLDISFK